MMRITSYKMLTLLFTCFLLIASSCSKRSPGGGDQGDSSGDQDIIGNGNLAFTEQCNENDECQSGLCITTQLGKICSRPCSQTCPEKWECRTISGGVYAYEDVCYPVANLLCAACKSHEQCGTADDYCINLDFAHYCGQACRAGSCPSGYACMQAQTYDGSSFVTQCLPVSGSCDCNVANDGLIRGCYIENSLGVCFGTMSCDGDSDWQACVAEIPNNETCNGLDDDCDGLIDDQDPDVFYNDFDGQTEAACNWRGSCQGHYVCENSGGYFGWICKPDSFTDEICDGLDNDCDGITDNQFILSQEQPIYAASISHCGGCGHDCEKMIPYASSLECNTDGGTPHCLALACQDGFFIYDDGAQCLPYLRTACQPCAKDEDCLTPGTKCISHNGEYFCGQDCSSSSVFHQAPTACTGIIGEQGCCDEGYSCEVYNDGTTDYQQCLPKAETCSCNQTSIDLSRACYVQDPHNVMKQCLGTQSCQIEDSIYNWTTCISEAYSREKCNYLDDDCDGQTDEDFINRNGTWLYDTDQHCGYCNNNCQAVWIPTIHNAIGVCDITEYPLRCAMRCLEMHVDVNGNPDDGCECQKTGVIDLPETEFSGYPTDAEEYKDTNCDGIDGVIQDALFVSAAVSTPGDGSRENPYQSITEALDVFTDSGKQYILVAQGVYNEQVVLNNGVQIHGGYSADFFSRNIVLYPSIILPEEPEHTDTYYRGSVSVECDRWSDVDETTILSGFTIYGYDVSDSASDRAYNSYALYVKDCSEYLQLINNYIVGGLAGSGTTGIDGVKGWGSDDGDATLNGSNGASGGENASGNPCTDTGILRYGGNGGYNPQCDNWGNSGGNAYCPAFYNNPDFYDGGSNEIHKGNQPEQRACTADIPDCCFHNNPDPSYVDGCSETPFYCHLPYGASEGVCMPKLECDANTECPAQYYCDSSGSTDFCLPVHDCVIDEDCAAGYYCFDGMQCSPGSLGISGLSGFDSSWNVVRHACNQVTESGFPRAIDNQDGEAGLQGATGHSGSGGVGCVNHYGVVGVANDDWLGASNNSGNGGIGSYGQPGGGGGATAGLAYHDTGTSGDCLRYGIGASAGGGGAGGCGGTGGTQGVSGGASFGIYVYFTNPPIEALPVIAHNLIQRGNGGDGGKGGNGAYGGEGGFGGLGADATVVSFTVYSSGIGGKGGTGGSGGGGGGGCGGASYGISLFNQGIQSDFELQNVFLFNDSLFTGGQGGSGGLSPDASKTGLSGLDGFSKNVIYFCGTGNLCPAGLNCINSICQ